MEFMYSKELFLNLIVEFLKVNCELSMRSAYQFLNFETAIAFHHSLAKQN